MNKKRDKFVYIVYCNKKPIVYGVYKSKHDAVRYAISLIRYRKKRAKDQGKKFGYYHFAPLPSRSMLKWMKEKGGPYYYDLLIFTACLEIPDEKDVTWGDDECHIRIERRVLN